MDTEKSLNLTEDEVKLFNWQKRVLLFSGLICSCYYYVGWFHWVNCALIVICSIWHVFGEQSVILNADNSQITVIFKRYLPLPMLGLTAINGKIDPSFLDYIIGFLGGLAILVCISSLLHLILKDRYIRCLRVEED